MRTKNGDDASWTTVSWADTPSVSTAIVHTVAELRGQAPEALPPLYDVIDPDGLDQLFDAESERRCPALLRLRYCRYEIELRGSGEARFAPRD
jgi:hypothetical protein